jgi:phytoene desaturase
MSVYKGAVFNLGHQISQMLMFRPHNKFEEFDNCYLAGGGTHPGSGLPTIYQSGIISASLIMKKYQVKDAHGKFSETNSSHQ